MVGAGGVLVVPVAAERARAGFDEAGFDVDVASVREDAWPEHDAVAFDDAMHGVARAEKAVLVAGDAVVTTGGEDAAGFIIVRDRIEDVQGSGRDQQACGIEGFERVVDAVAAGPRRSGQPQQQRHQRGAAGGPVVSGSARVSGHCRSGPVAVSTSCRMPSMPASSARPALRPTSVNSLSTAA